MAERQPRLLHIASEAAISIDIAARIAVIRADNATRIRIRIQAISVAGRGAIIKKAGTTGRNAPLCLLFCIDYSAFFRAWATVYDVPPVLRVI